MPDAGGIKAIKGKINSFVEETVDKDIQSWFGSTPASRGLRRVTLIKALGKAWDWFKVTHGDLPHRLAYRTGQVFRLQDNRLKQFESCRFRGYCNDDKTPKNPFTDKSYDICYKEYKVRNSTRRKQQEERKAKREMRRAEDEKKAERKRAKKKGAVSSSLRKRKRAITDSPGKTDHKKHCLPGPASESKLDDCKEQPTLGPSGGTGVLPLARPVRLSVQQITFEDRRISTEKYLNSLVKGDD